MINAKMMQNDSITCADSKRKVIGDMRRDDDARIVYTDNPPLIIFSSRYSVTHLVSDRHTKIIRNTIIDQYRLNNDDKSADEIYCFTLADEINELIRNAWLQLIGKGSCFVITV
jgi:hypothetical protein